MKTKNSKPHWIYAEVETSSYNRYRALMSSIVIAFMNFIVLKSTRADDVAVEMLLMILDVPPTLFDKKWRQ
jgi:hypothetical protein